MVHAWFRKRYVAGSNMLLFFLAFYSFAPPSGADEFRLFTTPAQRKALDQVRRAGPPEAVPALPAVPESLATRTDSSLFVRGFVQRQGGVNTVWVNDSSTLHPQDLAPNLRIDAHKIRDAKVPISIDKHVVNLKPGQVYLGDGQPVIESMQSRPTQSHSSASPTLAIDPNTGKGGTGNESDPMRALLEQAAGAAGKTGSPP